MQGSLRPKIIFGVVVWPGGGDVEEPYATHTTNRRGDANSGALDGALKPCGVNVCGNSAHTSAMSEGVNWMVHGGTLAAIEHTVTLAKVQPLMCWQACRCVENAPSHLEHEEQAVARKPCLRYAGSTEFVRKCTRPPALIQKLRAALVPTIGHDRRNNRARHSWLCLQLVRRNIIHATAD